MESIGLILAPPTREVTRKVRKAFGNHFSEAEKALISSAIACLATLPKHPEVDERIFASLIKDFLLNHKKDLSVRLYALQQGWKNGIEHITNA